MHAGCLVQASHLTTDVDSFLGSLSALRFSGGGGPTEAAIAEGLAEALVVRFSELGHSVGSNMNIYFPKLRLVN